MSFEAELRELMRAELRALLREELHVLLPALVEVARRGGKGPPEHADKYLSTQEAASYSGYNSTAAFRMAVSRGHFKVSGRRAGRPVFTKEDLDQQIMGATISSRPVPPSSEQETEQDDGTENRKADVDAGHHPARRPEVSSQSDDEVEERKADGGGGVAQRRGPQRRKGPPAHASQGAGGQDGVGGGRNHAAGDKKHDPWGLRAAVARASSGKGNL